MVLGVLHQLQTCSPAPGESTPSWTSTLNQHCPLLNYITWRTQIQGKTPPFIFTEILLTTFLYVCMEYSWVSVPWQVGGGQRTYRRWMSVFSFHHMGMELRSSGLLPNAFTPSVTSLAPSLYSFENFMHNYCIYIISLSPLFSSSQVMLVSLQFMTTSSLVVVVVVCVSGVWVYVC